MKRNSIQYILLFVVVCCLSSVNGYAAVKPKIRYVSAQQLTMVGKIKETSNFYHRMDTAFYSDIPDVVKLRLTRSAGLAISFKTNSNSISAKWSTNTHVLSPGLTSYAFRGLDLYIKRNGCWQFAGVGRPRSNQLDSSAKIITGLGNEEHECLLYLPIYTETTRLEIGVEEGATITPGDTPFDKRILVYGSSIVQGAGASRPGMAYTSRLSRNTGLNFLNLGTAAVAKMENSVARMIADIDADAYILDCVPNSNPEEIKARAAYLINSIRDKHPHAPIIVMQSVIRESGYFNKALGEKVRLQNETIANEVNKLQKRGMKKLYLLKADNFLGDDHEGTVDGTHPNDLGFDRMIEDIQPKLLDILRKEGICSK